MLFENNYGCMDGMMLVVNDNALFINDGDKDKGHDTTTFSPFLDVEDVVYEAIYLIS
jgi:hypothetical protein